MDRFAATRDVQLVYVAAFVRSATVSLVGVTLAIHLAALGLSVTQIGVLIGVGLAGSSLATVVVSFRGDYWGRRRLLVTLTVLSAVGYMALAAFTSVFALIPLAFIGMVNGMGRDRGAAPALEQAILPETVPDDQRTWTLAWYNVLLEGGHALGALAATIPTLLAGMTAATPEAAHRMIYLLCAASLLISVVPYLRLSRRIEVRRDEDGRAARAPLDARSKRVITRLALLLGFDSFGGGFLNSALIAYWFFHRHGISEADIALLFLSRAC